MHDDLMLRTEDHVIRTMRAALACVEPMLEPGIEPTHCEWIGVGWIVSCQSRRYMETRDILDGLAGGVHFVLDSGEVLGFTGARRWTTQVLEWARANGVLDRVVPWVVEREHALVVAYDKPAPTE